MDYAELLDVIREAAKKGAESALEAIRFGTAGDILGRGMGGDYSLAGDVASEKAVIEYLRARVGELRVVSEESGERSFGSAPRYTFIIDPIDGSRNYKRGLPFFAISIAVAEGETLDDIVAGAVYAPLLNMEFTAIRGMGAWLNGRKIRVTSQEDLANALVFVGATPKALFLPQAYALAITIRGGIARSLGSASLELSFVASGGADAYIDYWGIMRVIDIAAALLIAREAGAWVKVRGWLDRRGAISLRERLTILAASTEKLGLRLEEVFREALNIEFEEMLGGRRDTLR
ncbi:inositol monophosphatase [Infirmifilum lucidum]|uniref:Inositol monophosphatase n=1 Tax=Infirmifilum lucidum TaxID=2776706 RepID=A0A7L9FFC2_9CREN|nr:inositol monophosphatase [Infirmifilum lucidum]QOJ78419.1 inositol monophosphatase [Infirmifilum lucidum]